MSSQLPFPGLEPPGGARFLTLRGLLARFLGSAVSNSAGYAVGGAVLPTLEPLTQDLANETWSIHSVKPLAATAAAEAELRGYMAPADAAAEGARTGYNEERFGVLRRLHGQTPPIETLLTLRRRGVISPEQLGQGIEQAGYLPQWREALRGLIGVLPSVTDMVRFAVREVYDPAQRAALDLDAEFPGAFAADAERIGLSPERAGQYWAAHWELPSYEQGVQMLFRGEIDQGQFQRLLKAQDYAPVWRGPLEAIARAIPTMQDMIRFAVREVYDPQARQQLGLDADYPAAFTGYAALHGLDEQYARDYWAAHWRLPSAQQGYRMLWRGEINDGQLAGLLKALDYPAVWRDRLQAIAYLVPGRIDLKRMLRHGILERDQVKAGYRRLGYTEADAEHLTQIAEAEQSATTTTQPWLSRARSRLYTAAHDDFLDGNATEPDARALLAAVGATAAEQTRILELWNLERNRTRRDLTQAQVLKLYKKSIWPRDRAQLALEDQGMAAEDATALLDAG